MKKTILTALCKKLIVILYNKNEKLKKLSIFKQPASKFIISAITRAPSSSDSYIHGIVSIPCSVDYSIFIQNFSDWTILEEVS